MGVGLGSNLAVGFQKETTYNTEVTSALKGVYVEPTESFEDVRGKADGEQARQTKYPIADQRVNTLNSWTGGFQGKIPKHGFGYPLLLAFETTSTDGSGSHFTLKEASTDSYTFYVDRDVQKYAFAGGKLASMNIDWGAPQATFAITLEGGDSNTDLTTKSISRASTDTLYSRNHFALYVGSAGSAATDEICATAATTAFTFPLANGEDVSYCLGDASRNRLIAVGPNEVTGSFSFVYDSDNTDSAYLENDFRDGTKRSLKFVLSDTQSVTLNLLHCDFESFSSPIADTSLRRVTVNYKAFSAGQSTDIEFVVSDGFNTDGYSL